ncbi:hypothetical protein BJV77DRAFT_1057389 [Russula vinacea]|nr:hypothetical protein BJV77DRAFT_1057389 [Russula vinacea]
MVFVLRLEQCKRSMLRFPLHPTALPLTYIFTWRARNWFLAIDIYGDGELSHEELRTHSFQNPLQIRLNYRTDHALLTNAHRPLSAITVKYLVSVFDKNGDGVIGVDEFVLLWAEMNQLIRIFDSFDQDRNGRIDFADLGRALRESGIYVAPDVIDIVMKKYGEAPAALPRNQQRVPAPQMDLDHFLPAFISVRQMCGLYGDCSEGQPATIDRDAFLRAILALP